MFYLFRQNNSGGKFIRNDNVDQFVFIEADSLESANSIAETVGIYFDGSNDCRCCGNRWSPFGEYTYDKPNAEPLINGEPIGEYTHNMFNTGVVIHYKNGLIEHVELPK